MPNAKVALLLLGFLAPATGTPVLELDHTNFDHTVTKEKLFIVKFYGE